MVDAVEDGETHFLVRPGGRRKRSSIQAKPDEMTVKRPISKPADLARSRFLQNFWDDSGLRATIEATAEAGPDRLALAESITYEQPLTRVKRSIAALRTI
jgi:non-ribosomal peptide synthetase component E (peptide arylation enzyme)